MSETQTENEFLEMIGNQMAEHFKPYEDFKFKWDRIDFTVNAIEDKRGCFLELKWPCAGRWFRLNNVGEIIHVLKKYKGKFHSWEEMDKEDENN